MNQTDTVPTQGKRYGLLMTRIAGALRRAARQHGVSIGRYPHTGSVDDHLSEAFSRLSVVHVLDVGANDGGYVRRLRQAVGYEGTVSSFEPAAETCARLRTAAAPDSRWRVHSYALGEQSAVQALYRSSMSELNSLHVATDYGREVYGVDQATAEPVEVRRLDEVWDDVGPLQGDQGAVFLKTDTQGHDLAVLRGAQGVLGKIEGLQLEVPLKPLYAGMPSLADVMDEITRSGFYCSGVFPVSRDADLRLVEVDVIALREP